MKKVDEINSIPTKVNSSKKVVGNAKLINKLTEGYIRYEGQSNYGLYSKASVLNHK